jgi:hypothetical protein
VLADISEIVKCVIERLNNLLWLKKANRSHRCLEIFL